MQENNLSAWRTIGFQLFVVGILAVIAFVIIGAFSDHGRAPFSSAEVKFADTSRGGLSIVPASCPSSPHYSGECSGAPPTSPGSYCNLWLTDGATQGSYTLHWYTQSVDHPAIAYGSGSISPAIGSVGQSGSQTVTPAAGTTYTFSGKWCANTCVSVPYAAQTDFSCSVTTGNCPVGYISTPQGCVPQQCPIGYVMQGRTCVFTACPAGYTPQVVPGGSTQCVFTACPDGYTLTDGACVATVNSCTPPFICHGDDLYRRSGPSCTESLYMRCPYGCADSACLGPPAPGIVKWNVHPILVQSGSTVQVEWEAEHVSSCTVRGSNGDGGGSNSTGTWNTVTGDKISSPIYAQTIYTITCQALAGAAPAMVTRSTTVNVIPVFQEK